MLQPVICPRCGEAGEMPDREQGRKVRCPACNFLFVAPILDKEMQRLEGFLAGETQYFVMRKDKTGGPFSGEQLIKLSADGLIQPNHKIRKGEKGEWVLAGSIKGLLRDDQREESDLVEAKSSDKISENIPNRFLKALSRNALPEGPRDQLRQNEIAYAFEYIDLKGGCANQETAKRWILITNQRILYEAMAKSNNAQSGYGSSSGTIPIGRVSFVGTATSKRTEGCSKIRVTLLTINSSGGEIELAIPTEHKAKRLQHIVDELICAS